MALLTRTGLRINRYCSMADFPFFKMAAVRHLGFWKFRIFNGWDDQEGRTASACQILSKSLKTRLTYGDFSIFQDGDSMQILIFCTLSLKMPIYAPEIGGFGGFCPQNGEQYERDPQKAHPWAETRRTTYRSSKSDHVCALGASRRIK